MIGGIVCCFVRVSFLFASCFLRLCFCGHRTLEEENKNKTANKEIDKNGNEAADLNGREPKISKIITCYFPIFPSLNYHHEKETPLQVNIEKTQQEIYTPPFIYNAKNQDVSSFNMNEVWIDKQVILQRLHISSGTLAKWRREGILPYTRLFGKIYYKESDLQILLHSLHNKAE
jgi:hypothetical protein